MPTKMKVPENITSISFNQEEYKPDGDGFVMVPNSAVPVLASHGVFPHDPNAFTQPGTLAMTTMSAVEPDDEVVTDDTVALDTVVPANMSKRELVAYHQEHDLKYPVPTTVGALRQSVAAHREFLKSEFKPDPSITGLTKTTDETTKTDQAKK
jgi:hypothetical protein